MAWDSMRVRKANHELETPLSPHAPVPTLFLLLWTTVRAGMSRKCYKIKLLIFLILDTVHPDLHAPYPSQIKKDVFYKLH